MESKVCECCSTRFLVKDMKDDLCVNCYDFIKQRESKIISELEAKLAESQNTACKHIAELTKIATEKDKQIEELKQQLAEKETELKQEKENTQMWFDWKERYYKELQEVKQQLAEKDEQINKLQIFNKSLNSIKEDMRKRLDLIRTSSKKDYIRNMEQQIAEKDDEIHKLTKQIFDDEIELTEKMQDFEKRCQEYYKSKECTIERLEQLKYYIRLDNADEETGDMPYVVDTNCLFELIDNQIKQLKGK